MLQNATEPETASLHKNSVWLTFTIFTAFSTPKSAPMTPSSMSCGLEKVQPLDLVYLSADCRSWSQWHGAAIRHCFARRGQDLSATPGLRPQAQSMYAACPGRERSQG
jgi:hypothetical protein